MLIEMAKRAKEASKLLALSETTAKNLFLTTLAAALWEGRGELLQANSEDVNHARQDGLAEALIDRLTVNENRLKGIIADLTNVIHAEDPIGKVFDQSVQPSGLSLYRQRVPLGVIAVIYESRPNVTVDVASLAIKSGNAVILRGGKETLRTNRVFVSIIHKAMRQAGLPADAVQFIDQPDRALVFELLKLHQYVDMVIPRGGAQLHQICRENSTIPVITGGIGICHLFLDESANLPASIEVIRNAKIQRPSVCNALDTVLVHEKIGQKFLPELIQRLRQDGVIFHIDSNLMEHCGLVEASDILRASQSDFDIEWLSLNLSVKSVRSLDEAIAHIQAHSTAHSDGILTEDASHAEQFVKAIDSSVVYVNASTRFTDGAQLGLGSEVAVSTQRLHARGPMGLEELTTYKWVASGNYLTRK